MLRLLPRIFILAICVFIAATASAQQTDTTKPTSIDPDLLAIENARIPKEFTIRSIKITGINFLDTSIVQ
jgi:outer membrane protein insertion porin family